MMVCAWQMASAQVSPLSDPPINEDDILAYGGSFAPITFEHERLLAYLMTKFGFRKGVLLPTWPYKPGAVPAKISLRFTRTAITHFDEILTGFSPGVHDLRSPGEGRFHWVDGNGIAHDVWVDDVEIRAQAPQDTSVTLAYLKSHYGKKGRVFFLSGADSFLSLPTWHPNWKEALFSNAEWLVVNRPVPGSSNLVLPSAPPRGERKGLGILFKTPRDFRNSLPRADFDTSLCWGAMFIDSRAREKPGIFILSGVPTLDVSSSGQRLVLKSFDATPEQVLYLSPSVAREVITMGIFTDEGALTHYALHAIGQALRVQLDQLEELTGIGPEGNPIRRELEWAVGGAGRLGAPPEEYGATRSPNNGVSPATIYSSGLDTPATKALEEFRQRLLRAKVELLLARARLFSGLGINGAPFTLNIMQSELPRSHPLSETPRSRQTKYLARSQCIDERTPWLVRGEAWTWRISRS